MTEGLSRSGFDAPTSVETSVATGSGCHGGAATLTTAARAAGKSEVLDRYAGTIRKGRTTSPRACAQPSARSG